MRARLRPARGRAVPPRAGRSLPELVRLTAAWPQRQLRQRHAGRDDHGGGRRGHDGPGHLAAIRTAPDALVGAGRRRQQLNVGAEPVLDGVAVIGHAVPPTAALSLFLA